MYMCVQVTPMRSVPAAIPHPDYAFTSVRFPPSASTAVAVVLVVLVVVIDGGDGWS